MREIINKEMKSKMQTNKQGRCDMREIINKEIKSKMQVAINDLLNFKSYSDKCLKVTVKSKILTDAYEIVEKFKLTNAVDLKNILSYGKTEDGFTRFAYIIDIDTDITQSGTQIGTTQIIRIDTDITYIKLKDLIINISECYSERNVYLKHINYSVDFRAICLHYSDDEFVYIEWSKRTNTFEEFADALYRFLKDAKRVLIKDYTYHSIDEFETLGELEKIRYGKYMSEGKYKLKDITKEKVEDFLRKTMQAYTDFEPVYNEWISWYIAGENKSIRTDNPESKEAKRFFARAVVKGRTGRKIFTIIKYKKH